VANSDVFVWLMLAALLAGAIWLNIATASRAPVSTTHSIVGGVLGAGIAGGWGVANWGTMGSIAASWIIFRCHGRGVAERPLFHQAPDSLPPGCHGRAAPRVVPLLVAGMAWAFTLPGAQGRAGGAHGGLCGIRPGSGVVALLTYVVVRPRRPAVEHRRAERQGAYQCDVLIPLIFAAAL
jgi:PiT family inorganic phosphate transporter